ncbi:hypothetical protein M409DRAFT_20094 [Zasmidium cellare ATCC 36951]|uniref:Uncharacterized protein n=1 Tax=Zasmidium cellare ATCC 36951 TaxID=1080233 RepID=A0A6A6CV43_ZASCE|nr:uncharacterized protein M409DRAFT_20094 [Zasmidium cellare ATCC 36951]KAF2169679.1 hypothetical protein M409DRAFT_20094 [Zasmidium cellare ATCC 36951]
MIWDTLIQSQDGCDRIPYQEDAQVIAEWTLDSSSAPEDVTISNHAAEVCGCQADRRNGKACAYAMVVYQPLANSLRLKSFVWPNYRFEGDVIDDSVVCSTLEGRLEDLDLGAFDDLAKKKYKEVATEYLPPAFWDLYGDGDVDRKVALRNELIEVGAERVVESQKERSGMISSS